MNHEITYFAPVNTQPIQHSKILSVPTLCLLTNLIMKFFLSSCSMDFIDQSYIYILFILVKKHVKVCEVCICSNMKMCQIYLYENYENY